MKLECNFVNRWGYINTGTHLRWLHDFLQADAGLLCLFSEPARSCAMLQASSNILVNRYTVSCKQMEMNADQTSLA